MLALTRWWSLNCHPGPLEVRPDEGVVNRQNVLYTERTI